MIVTLLEFFLIVSYAYTYLFFSVIFIGVLLLIIIALTLHTNNLNARNNICFLFVLFPGSNNKSTPDPNPGLLFSRFFACRFLFVLSFSLTSLPRATGGLTNTRPAHDFLPAILFEVQNIKNIKK